MKPLRIAILWHFHQPDYRIDGSMFLPWVRLHAVKDYVDLPMIMASFPENRAMTFNVVPAMLEQVRAYLGGMEDEVQRLTKRPADDLTHAEQESIARLFVICQERTMIRPFPRFSELYDRIVAGAWPAFSVQEWRDLQVLYNLTWVGPVHRRTMPIVRSLVEQGRDYTEEQKLALLDIHLHIMASMEAFLATEQAKETWELSVTPFHHPILPLLCNTDDARPGLPAAPLPAPAFSAPDDADEQVRRAKEYWPSTWAHPTHGMWPAEGSVSMPALTIMARHGVRWAASDEEVLRTTLGHRWAPTSPWFPWTVRTAEGDIAMLFRDHALSDAIGFEYATWDAAAAADDFVRRLDERRRVLVREHGEDVLDHAVIPIILDGENCWEFYPENGEPFLKALMARLTDRQRFTMTTCGDATAAVHCIMPVLDHIVPGSWINGNFDVWIGSPVKNLAWSLLRDVRHALETTAGTRTGSEQHALREQLLAMEASDWFWWYDDRHQAPNKADFDVIFRRHLDAMFHACGVKPPIDLFQSLQTSASMADPSSPRRTPVQFGSAAMHVVDAISRSVGVETQDNWQRITIDLERHPGSEEELIITLTDTEGIERAAAVFSERTLWKSPLHDEGFEWRSPTLLAIYVHTSRGWKIDIEEEPQDGRIRTATVRI